MIHNCHEEEPIENGFNAMLKELRELKEIKDSRLLMNVLISDIVKDEMDDGQKMSEVKKVISLFESVERTRGLLKYTQKRLAKKKSDEILENEQRNFT